MRFPTRASVMLGLAASVMAVPTSVQLAQMAELKVETEAFIDNYPKDQLVALQREVSGITSPIQGGGCSPVYLIFVRGTFEPAFTDNLGAVVGMPFLAALKRTIGNSVSGTGVDYNNGVMGYLTGGDGPGGITMAKMIRDKVSQCPSTKIVASGYSQGAQVTHNALKSLPESVKSHIAAVVVFGDPYKDQPIPGIPNSKIFTNCEKDDPICKGMPVPLGTHLTYGTDTVQLQKVADFVKSRVS